MRRFEVVGIFAVGAQVGGSSALIHLEDAARLDRTGEGVHALRLALDDPGRAPALRATIAGVLPQGLTVSDWSRTQGTLFGAIRMEKRMVSLLLLVIVAVAAFNIVSILTMVVAEKRGAIAVLRTMGASPAQVMAVFSTQCTLIGVAGIAAGLAVGMPLAIGIGSVAAGLEALLGVRLFDPAVYFISYLPSELRTADVLAIAASALLRTDHLLTTACSRRIAPPARLALRCSLIARLQCQDSLAVVAAGRRRITGAPAGRVFGEEVADRACHRVRCSRALSVVDRAVTSG